MSLFDRLGGKPQQMQQPMDQRQAMEAMRHDVDEISHGPGAYLKARGFDIPKGMTDPRQITQHLLQTGQVGVPRLNQVVNMLGLRR